MLSGNTSTSIDVPGATSTHGYGTNDARQVLGWYEDDASESRRIMVDRSEAGDGPKSLLGLLGLQKKFEK